MAKVTTDDLAKMINKQFESIHSEIAGVKQNIEGLKQGQEKMQKDISEL